LSYQLQAKFGFQTYFFINFFLNAASPSAPAPTKSMVAGSGTGVGAPVAGDVIGSPGFSGSEFTTRLPEDLLFPPFERKIPIADAFPSEEISSKKGENNSMRLIVK
jgi:hypothetical protein